MLKYIINIIIILFLTSAIAQQDSLQQPVDSLQQIKHPLKARLGWDIGKYIWARLNNSTSYDIYADANVYKNYYMIFEAGVENHLTENSLLKYQTQGQYFKLGVDYNLYRNWLDMDNDISVGVRFGTAYFDYFLQEYRINQPGAWLVPQVHQTDLSFKDLSAQWLDFTTKIQAETFKNLYLGYAVSIKYLLHYTHPDNFDISYIPGFFERNAFSRFGFGMQYFISYQLKF